MIRKITTFLVCAVVIVLSIILAFDGDIFKGLYSFPSQSIASSTPSSKIENNYSNSTVVRNYYIHITAQDDSSVELHAFDSHGRHTGPIPNLSPGSDLLAYDSEILNSSYSYPNDIALNVEEGPYRIQIKFSSTDTITLTIVEDLSDFERGILDREVDKWELLNIKGEPGCVLQFSLGKSLKDSTQPQRQCPN